MFEALPQFDLLAQYVLFDDLSCLVERELYIVVNLIDSDWVLNKLHPYNRPHIEQCACLQLHPAPIHFILSRIFISVRLFLLVQ